MITLTLTVNPAYSTPIADTICQGESYTENGFNITPTEPGVTTQTIHLQAANGCDSAITLTLTVNPITYSDTFAVSYEPFTWHDVTYYESITEAPFPTYTIEGGNRFGCDSIVRLHLTLYLKSYGDTTVVACDSFTWHGVTYHESITEEPFPTYTMVGANQYGNDSIVSLHLTINRTTYGDTTAVACGSFVWHGMTFNDTPEEVPTFTMTNAANCDSIVRLHLTVNPITFGDTTVEACDSYTWHDSTYTVTPATNPTFTIEGGNQFGCDSVVTLYLTVYSSNNHYDTVNRCGETSYYWPRSGETYYQSGDYVYEHHEGHDDDNDGDHDHDDHGVCMHMDYLHLTIGETVETYIDTIHCGPMEWNGIMYTTSGYYTQELISESGCDSIVHMQLDISSESVAYLYESVPATDYPFEWRGQWVEHGGPYYDTVVTEDGLCDSVYIMIFTTICDYQVGFTSEITPALCTNNDASITVTSVQSDYPPYYFGINVMGIVVWEDSSMVGYHVYDSLAAPGMHVIIVRDANGCFLARPTQIERPLPHPLTCPPLVIDTLTYGEPFVTILPEDLGMPSVADWDPSRLIYYDEGVPEGYHFTDGVHVIERIVEDTVCGKTWSCDQQVIVVFPECPNAVDCEGNVYNGIRIGSYCWTQRNLESLHYQNPDGSCGDPIQGIYNYASILYPDTAYNVQTFGRLYSFDAAIHDGADNGYGHVQGICPAGWYLPTPEQYAELNTYGAAALRSPDYWLDGGGNNSTLFTWLPAGFYNGGRQRFEGLYTEGYFWATERVDGELVGSPIYTRCGCDYILQYTYHSGLGLSIRCIKERD